jgi:hypothetical protein
MLLGLAFCLAVLGTKELLVLIENYVIDIQSAQASNNIFVSVAIVTRLNKHVFFLVGWDLTPVRSLCRSPRFV